MNPNKQRIAIAEACKFKTVMTDEEITLCLIETPETTLETDVLSDLNAMHEVEKTLVDDIEKCLSYQRALLKSCEAEQYNIANSFIWHATATQRAEAFLRTVGKWEEGD